MSEVIELTREARLIRANQILSKALTEAATLLREPGLPRPVIGVTGELKVNDRVDADKLRHSLLAAWDQSPGKQIVSNIHASVVLTVEVVDRGGEWFELDTLEVT